MNPVAELVFKASNSSVNYINNAIDYVNSLEYYCSVKCEYTEIRSDNIPAAIFILTSEECSSYITDAQFKTWYNADKWGVPVYVIYKRKGTDELVIYTATVSLTNSGSVNQYARVDNFSRVPKYDTYHMCEITKTLGRVSKFHQNKPVSNAGIKKEELDEELLLLVKL